MKITTWIQVGWILILPLSCIDEINLKVSDVEDRLVIEGLIADSLDTYSIRVKYARNKGIYPVSDAVVKVIDDQGNVNIFEENQSDLGNYLSLMRGEVGKSYFVEVTTPDHKTIRSIPTILVKGPSMDNLIHETRIRTYINSAGQQVEEKNVYIKADISFATSDKPFLRWRTSGEYEFHESPGGIAIKWCYVNEKDDFNKLNIYNPRFLNSQTLKGQEVNYTALDHRFSILYCFHIRMYTMNEPEFQYWRSLNNLLENDGTLYDPPPGNVKGNLYNTEDATDQVIGYFSVSGVDYKRYFMNAQSTGYTVRPLCDYSNRFNTPCGDCLILRNSTLDRPSYWP